MVPKSVVVRIWWFAVARDLSLEPGLDAVMRESFS